MKWRGHLSSAVSPRPPGRHHGPRVTLSSVDIAEQCHPGRNRPHSTPASPIAADMRPSTTCTRQPRTPAPPLRPPAGCITDRTTADTTTDIAPAAAIEPSRAPAACWGPTTTTLKLYDPLGPVWRRVPNAADFGDRTAHKTKAWPGRDCRGRPRLGHGDQPICRAPRPNPAGPGQWRAC